MRFLPLKHCFPMPWPCGPAMFLTFALCGCTAQILNTPEPENGYKEELCSRIAGFANAARDHVPHAVTLITFWGIREVDGQISLGEIACNSRGYEPGKKLCQYLLEHSSMEFADINVARALHCLQGGDRFAVPGPASHYLLTAKGSYESERVSYTNTGVLVRIDWAVAEKDNDSSLTITARRGR